MVHVIGTLNSLYHIETLKRKIVMVLSNVLTISNFQYGVFIVGFIYF